MYLTSYTSFNTVVHCSPDFAPRMRIYLAYVVEAKARKVKSEVLLANSVNIAEMSVHQASCLWSIVCFLTAVILCGSYSNGAARRDKSECWE